MRIKAALYNADHLEYGLVTIPFPIPQDQYNDTIKMLEALDIGDPRAKDCMVEEIEGCVPSLKCLEGHRINVDELDYLVKRLDSFSDGELVQFQGMAAKMGLSDMTDLINLTFCCQQATVITDFSDLEQIGRDHYMYLHGGCVSMEELEELDGMETALLLISENEGMWSNFPLIEQAHRRLADVVVENQDFGTLIRHYDRPVTFFYCDPPYHATEGYYQNIGEGGFTERDHIRLRDALLSMEGKFLLSYNDDAFIRGLYDAPGIQIEPVTRLNNIRQRYDPSWVFRRGRGKRRQHRLFRADSPNAEGQRQRQLYALHPLPQRPGRKHHGLFRGRVRHPSGPGARPPAACL